ncbi:hypothetical protein J3R30DRAFT_417034 [Lentinula aciculospora]|uniref:Uncharacterized protein n=1 Tax=Lentinula aciculospora TaxID=153920 RepID=A0A9W9A8I0_9AGAR|nr:hypothetical protein J3R30DRAFT_417034 [Lentinula aciculospora]
MSAVEVVDNSTAVIEEVELHSNSKPLSEAMEDETTPSFNGVKDKPVEEAEFHTSETALEESEGDKEKDPDVSEDVADANELTLDDTLNKEEESGGALATIDRNSADEPTSDSSVQPLEAFPNTSPYDGVGDTEITFHQETSHDSDPYGTGTGEDTETSTIHEAGELRSEVELESLIQETTYPVEPAPEAASGALPDHYINGNSVDSEADDEVFTLETSPVVTNNPQVEVPASQEYALNNGIAEDSTEGEGFEEQGAEPSTTEEVIGPLSVDRISDMHISDGVILASTEMKAVGAGEIGIPRLDGFAGSIVPEESSISVTRRPPSESTIDSLEKSHTKAELASTVESITADGLNTFEVPIHLTEDSALGASVVQLVDSGEQIQILASDTGKQVTTTTSHAPAEAFPNEQDPSAKMTTSVGEGLSPPADIILDSPENIEIEAGGSHSVQVEASARESLGSASSSLNRIQADQVLSSENPSKNEGDVLTEQATNYYNNNELSLEGMPMDVDSAFEPLGEKLIVDVIEGLDIETAVASELGSKQKMTKRTDDGYASTIQEFSATGGGADMAQQALVVERELPVEESFVVDVEEAHMVSEAVHENLVDELVRSQEELMIEPAFENVAADSALEEVSGFLNEDAPSTESENPLAETVKSADEVALNVGQEPALTAVEEVLTARDEIALPQHSIHVAGEEVSYGADDPTSATQHPPANPDTDHDASFEVIMKEQSNVELDKKDALVLAYLNLVENDPLDSAISAAQSTETEEHVSMETDVSQDENPAFGAGNDDTVASTQGEIPTGGDDGSQLPQQSGECADVGTNAVEAAVEVSTDHGTSTIEEIYRAVGEEAESKHPNVPQLDSSLEGSPIADNNSTGDATQSPIGENILDVSSLESTAGKEQSFLGPDEVVAEVTQDEAATVIADSNAPVLEGPPSWDGKSPAVALESQLVEIIVSAESLTEISSDTTDLKEMSIDQEIQPTEPTTSSSELAAGVQNDMDVETVAQVVSEDSVDLSVDAAEIERPKSPWIPSYGVVNQGPEVAVGECISETEFGQLSPPDLAPSAEQPMPVVNVVSEESGPLVVKPEETQGLSRPSSPWVPSYSVSVQGSPSVSTPNSPVIVATEISRDQVPASQAKEFIETANLLSNEDIPEIDTAMQFVGFDQQSQVPLDVPSEDVQEHISRIQPDQPDQRVDSTTYSEEALVDPDAGSTLQEAPETEDASSEGTKGEEEAYKIEDSTELADVGHTAGDEEAHIQTDSSNLSVNATEIERPKSPWTPSYSVINQGLNVVFEEDIPDIEQLPPSDVPVSKGSSVPEVNIIPEVSEATVANVSPMIRYF